MRGKAASSLTRITWVHPARKVVIEAPDTLNSFVNTMKMKYSVKVIHGSEGKGGDPSIESTFPGDLVFEFSDGSYFTLGCQEYWSPQENRFILGYNPWWAGDALSWRAPTKHATFAPYPEKFNDIYGFFIAPWADESNVCYQIMRIDASGNIESIDTNQLYRSNKYQNYHDYWGEYHYMLESWAYLILGIMAILSLIIARYLLCCVRRCSSSIPPSQNTERQAHKLINNGHLLRGYRKTKTAQNSKTLP